MVLIQFNSFKFLVYAVTMQGFIFDYLFFI